MCWKDVTENIHVWNCNSTLRGLGPWPLWQQLVRMQFQSRSFLWPAFPQNQECKCTLQQKHERVRPFSCGKLQQNTSFLLNLLCKMCNEGRKHLCICLPKQANWSTLKWSSAAAYLEPPITTLHTDPKYLFKPADYKLLWAIQSPSCVVLWNTGMKVITQKHPIPIRKFPGKTPLT